MSARLVVVLAAAALAGCATVVPRKEVVWPLPPETPRIRFDRAFAHTEDMDSSTSHRIAATLLGASPDPGLKQPMGLALSDDGQRLYIADYALGGILVADFAQKQLKPYGSGELVGRAFGVALGDDETVFVSVSSPARVVRLGKDGAVTHSATGDVERPTGIAINRSLKRIYVADGSRKDSKNHRIVVFDFDLKKQFEIGRGKGQEDGQFYFPTYLTLDARGNLYVADSMNFRIQMFDPAGRFLRKYGENGDGPGQFARMKGLAFDGFGNLYSVDSLHSVVQMLNPNFQMLMWFGGNANMLEFFDIPSCIAIDPKTNRIYVCNEGVARINVYDLINTKAEDSFAKPPPPAEPAKKGSVEPPSPGGARVSAREVAPR